MSYYDVYTPMVGETVNLNTFDTPVYYSTPDSYYAPAGYDYIDYSYYTDYSYYEPTTVYYPATPQTPAYSAPVASVPTSSPTTPIVQGIRHSVDKVADLGPVGDGKTIEMNNGLFRTLIRTGTNSYSWTDTDKNGNVIATGTGGDNSPAITNTIVFQPSSTPAKAQPSQPVTLVQASNGNSVSTSDIPNPGDRADFYIGNNESISVRRRDDGAYEYSIWKDTDTVIPPWQLMSDAPSGALAAPFTPVPAYSAPTAQLKPYVPSPPPITTETVPSVSPAPTGTEEFGDWMPSKPAGIQVFIQRSPSDQRLVIQAASGGGDTADDPGDESAEPPIDEALETETFYGKLLPDASKPKIQYPAATGKSSSDAQREQGLPAPAGFTPDAAPPVPTAPPSDFEAEKKAKGITEHKDIPTPTGPVTSATQDPFSPSEPQLKDLPRTEEDKRLMTFDFLVQHQDELGMTDQEIFAVGTHFYPWASKMYQEGYDLSKLGQISIWYDGLINGDVDAFNQLGVVVIRAPWGQTDFDGFKALTPEQQQAAIIDFNKKLAENDIPAEAVVLFNSGIYAKLGEDDSGDDTRHWMMHDGVLKALQNDWKWNQANNVSDFLHSSEGQAVLGGAALIGGAALGFLAAGPVGAAAGAKLGAGTGALITAGAKLTALAGVGTLPFALTELPFAWQDTDFKMNARLERAGTLGKSVDAEADQMFNNYKAAVDAYNYNTNTEDEAQNLALKDSAERAGQAYKDFIIKNAFALDGTDKLTDHISRYDTQQTNQDAIANRYDETGGYDNPKAKETRAEFNNMREGWKVVFNGEEIEGKGTEKSKGYKTPVTSGITLVSPEGKSYASETVRLFADGNNPSLDVGFLIDKALSYGSKTNASSTGAKTTITVPAGVQFTYEGKTYKAGDGGTSYDIKRTVGAPLRITFESTDGSKKPLTEYIGYPETGWNSYSVPADLKGVIAQSVEGFQTHLSEGQRLFWKDLDITQYVDKETGLVVMPEPGYYNISVVNPDGSKETKNVYLGENKVLDIGFEAIPAKPFTPYSKSSGGSGGGGGGGSSARSSGSSSQAKPAEQTLIKYGPTCEGADIWQDEIRVYPEIDTPYSIDPGYHSIKVVRTGKKEWLKTVYCASGDTITVSPAFEDDYTTPPPEGQPEETAEGYPKRVFINSNPSAAKVLINDSASGEWTPCYFDLDKGFYKFTIQKTGYDPYDILCYVGESIMWNDQAVAMAEIEGLI